MAISRPADHHKETQTAVVWTCLPFIKSGQNHFARHSERGKKTRQAEEEVGRQCQGMDRPGVCQFPEGSGEQGKWRKLVAKSSVVPQRPSRLRDRCDDEMRWERERERVKERERDRDRDRDRERRRDEERERQTDRQRETETERDRERESVCVCVCACLL